MFEENLNLKVSKNFNYTEEEGSVREFDYNTKIEILKCTILQSIKEAQINGAFFYGYTITVGSAGLITGWGEF